MILPKKVHNLLENTNSEKNLDIAMQWYNKFSEDEQTKFVNEYVDRCEKLEKIHANPPAFDEIVLKAYNVAKFLTKNGTKKTDMWGKKR